MIGMFLTCVFYTKIVYNKGQGNWLCGVLPETGCIDTLVISVRCKSFLE